MQGLLRNRTLLFIVVISLMANIVMLIYFGWAREHYRKNAHNNWPHSPITDFLKRDVGFTEKQMTAYDTLRTQNRQKMKPLIEDIRLAKVRFYGYLDDEQINDSLVDMAVTQIGEKQKAIDLQTFKNFRQLRTLCTEQQKTKYDSLVAGVISNMWFSPRNGPPDAQRK